ncbi:MAG: squalene/phytoene synthase family protein [Oceanicaulis sp.]|nr:squalene/phytoene synthase family protein [Oceanicaulis sp.]
MTDTVRRDDPDRYLAALFAPETVRTRLLVLYAFYGEIARIPDAVSEPVIGEMRLAWARDAVGDLFASPRKVRRHDVYEALADMLDGSGAPDQESLLTLVEARNADLGEGAFPDAAEREAYVDRTAGTLVRLAARACAPDWVPGEAGEAALKAAGRAWGYTGLLRAFAPLCTAGRPPLTAAEMDAAGLLEAHTVRAMEPDKANLARQGLIREAAAALHVLRATAKSLPPEVFPAVGFATLARGYLKAVTRQSAPYAPLVESPLIWRQARLLMASLSGRI